MITNLVCKSKIGKYLHLPINGKNAKLLTHITIQCYCIL